jgi:hypothetical protein
MKKFLLILFMVLFFAFLFVVDVESQNLEASLIRDQPYAPLWFEGMRYFLVALAICCFVWYSLITKPSDKVISLVYLVAGVLIFLLFSYNGFYFLHSKFVFPPALHKIYVTAVSSKLNFIRIGASVVTILGLLRLTHVFKSNRITTTKGMK